MTFFLNFFIVLYNKLFRKNFDHFLDYKYTKVKQYYGESCLDIGAGYGHFSDFLRRMEHVVHSIDVTDKFLYINEFSLFDGSNIPLEDDCVDTSVIMFVLHHTNTQLKVLKEASRVTRGFIIIGEDVMKTSLDKMMGNIHLNTSPWNRSDNLFHSVNEWENIFKDLNLKLIETIDIPRKVYPIYPVNRKIFVLTKT